MLESPPSGPDAPVVPKIKRQLFKNQPAWATPDSNAAIRVNDDDFFSRSTETLSSYSYKEERKNKKRASVEPTERSKKIDNKDSTAEQVGSKRRRLSPNDPDYELYGPAETSSSEHEQFSKPKNPSKSPDVKINKVKDKGKAKKPPPVIIDLDDDDDDDDEEDNHSDKTIPNSPAPAPAPAPEPQSSSSSPIESIETAPAISTPPRQPTPKLTSSSPIEVLDAAPTRPQPKDPPPKPLPPAFDPVLNILIHSRLPNTAPLIAQRKFSQRLAEVRLAWCKRQNLTPEQTEVVFLTWRGQRVFDFTTCRSLGIQVNAMGEVYIKGQVQPPGEEGTQIEMEAVTPEIMAQIKEEKAQKARAPRGEDAADEEASASTSANAASSSSEGAVEQLRIILRSKDYREYRVAVKTTTKFAQIEFVYRRNREIPADKQVILMFEGEQLDSNATINDSDIGDMDFVDVYVK